MKEGSIAENIIFRTLEGIIGLFFLGVIGVLLVADHRFYYMYKNQNIVPNLLFFVLFLCFSLRILLYVRVMRPLELKNFRTSKMNVWATRRVIFRLSLALFIVQIVFTWNIFFKTGWDCAELVGAAQRLAFEGQPIGDLHYFSIYPNNVFLVGLFAGILKITNFTRMLSDYYVLVLVGALLVTMAGFFMADLVRILTNSPKLVYSTWVIFAILTGLSPWVSVPYSDTYSIIFPILVVWLFVTRNDRNNAVSWFLITFFAFVGYFIKPTVILSFMVVVMVAFVHFVGTVVTRERDIALKRTISFAIGTALAIAIAFGSNMLIKSAVGFTPDENKSFTAFHYLMMGMNVDSGGGYNQWDANFSASAPDVATRNEQDFNEAMRRIEEMGLSRFASFMCQKILTNFNDGSFAWGFEGEFYWYIQDRDNHIAPVLRSYYYESGEYYYLFQLVSQAIWFMVLIGLTFSLISIFYATDYRYVVVRLCVFAIALFLLVFEARARYLYLYSPLIYTASALGMDAHINRIQTRELKRKRNATHISKRKAA